MRLLITIAILFSAALYASAQSTPTRWKEASFTVVTPGITTFHTAPLAYVFTGEKNSIVRVAPELEGLTGLRVPMHTTAGNAVKIKCKQPVRVLYGVPQGTEGPGRRILQNAVTITGLAPVDVYAMSYKSGTQTILEQGSAVTILGVVIAGQAMSPRDAMLPDGRMWQPFITDGFYDGKPLFEILGGPDTPVIDEGMAGTESILGGFEGGACVKIDKTYHMFPTERAGQEGIEAYFDRVKTRIGHWTSTDAIHWKREGTLYEASGTYAVTNDDNPLNDRRGAIWSYMPVFNKQANRWYGYYLAYTVHREISPNHSFGRIWRAESTTPGIEGIAGPYRDCGIVMEPGLDTQLWEGRQGVDSFYPYPVKDGWLALYGGAYPYKTRSDYPDKMFKAWYVGLAKSATLEGPWIRMDTTINPVKSIHPSFIENPIVYTLPNGTYIAVFDGGPEAWGLHLPNMMGYSLSKDGFHWSEARYLPVETKVKKWWTIMRTPVCLVDEGNDVYTIVYAAIDTAKRFHPMGMVKLKLNTDVLKRLSE